LPSPAWLLVCCADLVGATAQPAEAVGAGTATVKEFQKIKKGQKLAKVHKVVCGRGAKVTGITEAPVYVWHSTGGKNAYVLFDTGRVADKVRMDDERASATRTTSGSTTPSPSTCGSSS
jgi:hypothetical protein